ncbi:MAG: hypothetical protein ABI986_05695 [Chloroflexota bacterium]
MLRKSLYIVGGLFITAVFAAAVVLGVWAYSSTLNWLNHTHSTSP